MPMTVTVLRSWDMACSLSGCLWPAYRWLGREHGRTIPLADLDQKRRSNTDFSSPVIRGGLAIGKTPVLVLPKRLASTDGRSILCLRNENPPRRSGDVVTEENHRGKHKW